MPGAFFKEENDDCDVCERTTQLGVMSILAVEIEPIVTFHRRCAIYLNPVLLSRLARLIVMPAYSTASMHRSVIAGSAMGAMHLLIVGVEAEMSKIDGFSHQWRQEALICLDAIALDDRPTIKRCHWSVSPSDGTSTGPALADYELECRALCSKTFASSSATLNGLGRTSS